MTKTTRREILAAARAAATAGDAATARALFALVGVSYVPAVCS